MVERTVRLMTKDDVQVIARRHGESAAECPEVDAACRAAGGAVVGLVVGVFLWQASGGDHVHMLPWLMGCALFGAALGWYAPPSTPEGRRRHVTESMADLWRRSDTRVVTLKATVVGAVALEVRARADWLVLDVEDGRLLALPTCLGEIRLGYLGFPHERFELEVAVLRDDPHCRERPCYGGSRTPLWVWLVMVMLLDHGDRRTAPPTPLVTEMLRYRGEGATVLPSRTLVGRQVGRIPAGGARRVETGLVFTGTLATCAADLQSAWLDEGED